MQQDGGVWGEPSALTDGLRDAWHTNIERRPDGSALAGWDEGTGGTETQLYVMGLVQSEAQAVEDISRSSRPGERPHFAFGADGVDHLTWFHKIQGRPAAVYTRSGRSGDWGELEQPSAGLGGFHYDPDLAIRDDGTLCIVWGWDGEDLFSTASSEEGAGRLQPRWLSWTGASRASSIEVDNEGRFHVVWSQGVRGENHVYYALLDDD